MTRSTWFGCMVLCCSLWLAACAASRPATVASPTPAPTAAEQLPQVLPFEPGPIPEGWKFAGLSGPVVAFVSEELKAAMQFSFFPAATRTPEQFIRTVIARSTDPGIRFGEVSVSADGTEASVSLTSTDLPGGEPPKAGRLVVRSFPGRTIYGATLLGLWPQADDAVVNPLFEGTFKTWMRLK